MALSAIEPFALDRSGATPLHAQVADAIRNHIRDHRLTAGTVLPAKRRCATASAWRAAWCGRPWAPWWPKG